MAELSYELDQLEALCLYALWVGHQAEGMAADDPVPTETIAKAVEELRTAPVQLARLNRKLKQLCDRGFATASSISHEDGRAGRKPRGYKMASSDKIIKWPATAAILHFLLHHNLLPIPARVFFDEVERQNFHDHKTNSPLSQLDIERQVEHSIKLGYIVRQKEVDDTYTLNVGQRTKWEAYYLWHLGSHAQATQRKPPSQASIVESKNNKEQLP